MDIKAHPLEQLARNPNIADLLDDAERSYVANMTRAGYDADVSSRQEWETRSAEALKLALQVREDKTEPWPNCANIKFPLVTIAALHYHARAYPLLVDDNDLVKVRVFGADPDGSRNAAAARVAEHMTWQDIEQMDEWSSEHDKTLLVQAILGVAVKKRWFDPVLRRQRTVLIGVDNFVVSYYTRGDLNECPRATHVMELTPNQVYERVVRGVFCNLDEDKDEEASETGEDPYEVDAAQQRERTTQVTAAREKRTGVTPPALDVTAPIVMLEQACWLDLDGDDYAEPYFVTVERDSGKLRRIVARFTMGSVQTHGGKVISITPEKCYVKYGLIPAPDGSWYDLGFGHLLGPINASVDSALNQLFDAGTMNTLGGGFLGRGARFRAGDNRFKPYEWKTLDSTGDDIRKNIVALQTNEPSRVLFELMMYLVQYAERTASANEVQMGENPGQNTPAETTRTMNANGQRIFAAIFKRTWRAQRDEFRIQFLLNRTYLQVDEAYLDETGGVKTMVSPRDYAMKSSVITPAADPTVTSDEERRQRAAATMQMALSVPGFNRYKAVRRYLEVMRIPAIDEIFPKPQPVMGPDGKPQGEGDLPVPPDPKLLKVQVDQQKVQLDGQRLQIEQQKAQMDLRNAVIEMQQQAQKVGAEILELRARSIMELAQAKGIDQGHQIALIDALIGAKKTHMDTITSTIDAMSRHIETMRGFNDAGDQPSSDGSGLAAATAAMGSNGAGGMAGAPPDAGVFSLAQGGANGANGSLGAG